MKVVNYRIKSNIKVNNSFKKVGHLTKLKKLMRKRPTHTERNLKRRKNLIKRAKRKNFRNSVVGFVLSVAGHVQAVIA